MSVLRVTGNSKVVGEITASGAKNSALPILSSVLLLDGCVNLSRVPDLQDVTNLVEILGSLGVQVLMKDSGDLFINSSAVSKHYAPHQLVRKMRASFLVLGPLLARLKKAKVSLPGGCAIGSRPVDLHIYGLRQLGAVIEVKDGYVEAVAPSAGLVGGVVDFIVPSVTATENVLMAAVLAKGKTVINGAAREPEVMDLANFLNSLGARIVGAGTEKIVIDGVEKLNSGLKYSIMGDRIEAGTFLIAAAMTKGEIKINGIDPKVLESPIACLKQAGATIQTGKDWVALNMQEGELSAVSVSTEPYPGFPTDLQAQWLALNVVAKGSSTVVERVFENRLMHVNYLNKMGANLEVDEQLVFCKGSQLLHGVEVEATDLRASACLLLAGLVATGFTKINKVYHIDRGYEYIEAKFAALGCEVVRIDG